MSGGRTLLTFGPMIDSELSRLLLQHYGLEYREERHLFGWVSVLALFRAGTLRVPVLSGDGPAIVGPRALVDRYEETCAPAARVLPSREPLRTAVEQDWQRFNGELAAYTAQVAYFHLLPEKKVLIEPFARGVPPSEAKLTRPVYPILRWLFTLLLQLQPARIADALARIRASVAHVDARIADGRRFLQGDALTLGDLALASALCPLLLPEGHTSPLPPFSQMPSALQVIITELRASPTAELVTRIYATRGSGSAKA